MSRLTGLLKTWPGRVLIILIIGGVVGGQMLYARATVAPAAAPLRTAPVTRATITQTVAVSGSVNAAATYRLGFKLTGGAASGRLTDVYVAVGDLVKKDQPLARIDASDLRTTLATAQSNLDTAQARYDQVVAGADVLTVADAKRALDKATTAYASAKSNLQSNGLSLQQNLRTYSEKLTTLRNQLVKIQFQLQAVAQPVGTPQPPTTESPANTPEPTQNTAKVDARSAVSSMNVAQAARDNAETANNDTLTTAYGEYNAAYANVQSGIRAYDAAMATDGDTSQANSFYQTSVSVFTSVSSKLSSSIDVVNGYISTVSSSVTSANNAIQAGGSRYEINLNGARYELGLAQTMLVQFQQLVSGDKTRISQASISATTIGDAVSGSILSSQSSLQRAQATARPTDVLTALASIQSAQTALQNAKDNLEFATLRAPAEGTIATVLNQVGENVTATVMTMANTTSLTLRGTIGEADVAKLRVGQVATLTVDAVGATAAARMTGKVTSIDPVATIQSGVPVYGVDTQVDIAAPGVRAGMSGTANVIIATRQNVIAVVNLAIRSQGTRRYVQIMKDGQPVDADVTFGIAGDTVTEVLTGLSDGAVVVLPAPRVLTSARPAGGGPPGFVGR